MKKEKVLKLMFLPVLATFTAVGLIARLSTNNPAAKADAATHTLLLEGKGANANRLTEEEAAAGEFTRTTSEGNPIVFKTSGSDTIKAHTTELDNRKWCDVYEQGYIYNETPIHGLKKITFTGNWDYDVRVYYGSTMNYEYSVDYFVEDGVDKVVEFAARGLNIAYFKYEIVHLSHSTSTATRFMEITYSCDTAPNEEAPTFTAGKDRTIKLSKEYSTTDGVIDLDVKTNNPTDQISVMLFNSKTWNYYFGYYSIKVTGMDSFKGITATTLPDGYTRFTFKLGELNRTNQAWNRDNVPESVDSIYIRGNWTVASGYAEAEPNYHFVSTRGEAFTYNAGLTHSFTANEPVTYTSKLVFDVKFVTRRTEVANNNIRFMVGNWSNYYGYFKIYPNGSYDASPKGIVSSEILIDGYIRYTIDFSIAGTSDTPDAKGGAMQFWYKDSRWCGWDGYVQIVEVR